MLFFAKVDKTTAKSGPGEVAISAMQTNVKKNQYSYSPKDFSSIAGRFWFFRPALDTLATILLSFLLRGLGWYSAWFGSAFNSGTLEKYA